MDPSWQKIKLFELKADSAQLWNLVTSYIPGARLLRLTVVAQDEKQQTVSTSWSPVSGRTCGADGIFVTPAKSGLLNTGALYGALIGKVGGSSADVPDISSPTAPYGSKRVFAVGSHCVISLANTEGGPLYLTMNDNPDGFVTHSGSLHILMEEYCT